MSQPLLRIHHHHPSSCSYSCSLQPPSPSSHSSLFLSSSSSSSSSSAFPFSPISISFRFIAPVSSLTPLHQLHHSSLIPISSDSHFDQLLAHHHTQQPLVILWMANWCRSCIYLKPKLEKLAAEYDPRLQFYSVDVNTVSHKLVARAGLTKMPTIQLWKDGKKQAEVIGGRKAHWTISDVLEMIENECSV